MKKLVALLMLILSFSAYSSPDLTNKSLSGKWLIVMSGGISPQEFDLGDDYWTFSGTQFQVETSGKSLSPDPYKIEGSKIIYGKTPYDVSIDVISISELELEVRTSGIIQILKKVK